ncbi:MAG: XVIPCD domain-containing protein [Pseudoxanthomonas sp.]
MPRQIHGDAPPPQPGHPADPDHPDHGLHRQIRERVGALHPGLLQNHDQLSMSLLAEAKAQGLSRVDHVIPSQATANLHPGEHLFLVQGRADDPATHRVMVNTAAATNTPVAESLSRIEHLNHAAAQAPVIDEQQRNITHYAPSIRLG